MFLILVNVLLIVGVLGRRFIKRRTFILVEERRLRWVQRVEQVLAAGILPAQLPHQQTEVDREAAVEALLSRWENASPDQRRLLQSLFRAWRLERAKRRQIRQGGKWGSAHAALVLGRFQITEALPDLLWLLPRATSEIQVAVVNALELMEEEDACEPLLEFLTGRGRSRSAPVLSALITCCRNNPERLVPFLRHSDSQVRIIVTEALVRLATVDQLSALMKVADDKEPEVRAKIARVLGRLGNARGFLVLKKLARDPVWFVRLQAVGAMAPIRSPQVTGALIQFTRDSHWRVRGKAATALYQNIGDPALFLRTMRELVDDRYAVEAAVAALEREGDTWKAIDALGVSHSGERKKGQALVIELFRVGRVTALLYALEIHPSPKVRKAILRLLKKHADATMAPALQGLLVSSFLGEEERRGVESLLARWKD